MNTAELSNMLADCRVTDEYVFFYGSPFSQWYDVRFEDEDETISFSNAEQYMMYHKALLFQDLETTSKIMGISSPKTAKALGRTIKNFDQKLWDENKLEIVTKGNILKFTSDQKLIGILLATGGRVIVEASPYDKIWGIGMGTEDLGVENPSNWKGLNLLGVALMSARFVIKMIEEEIG